MFLLVREQENCGQVPRRISVSVVAFVRANAVADVEIALGLCHS